MRKRKRWNSDENHIRQKYNSLILVFAVFFVFLLVQHHFVALYFDDWQYLSLSYHYRIEGVSGFDFTFTQLIEFLKGHYMLWGGRILNFGIYIGLSRISIVLYKCLQVIVLTGIFVLIYKMVFLTRRAGNKVILAVITCSLYGLLQIEALRSGVYWFTASVLYVLPMFPFLLLLYRCMCVQNNKPGEKDSKKAWVFDGILAFLACFSQEQISIATVVMILFFSICERVKNKHFSNRKIVTFLAGMAGFLLLYLAPGNRVRLGADAQIPLPEKLLRGAENFVMLFFSHGFALFGILLFAVTAFGALWMIRKRQGIRLLHMLYIFCTIVYAFMCIRSKGYIAIYAEAYGVELVYIVIFGFPYLGFMLYELIQYFVCRGRTQLIPIIFAAIVTCAPCAYAPYLAERMFIPAMFLFMIIAGNIMLDMLEEKGILLYIGGVFCFCVIVIGYINMGYVMRGYGKNYAVFQRNEKVMKDYDVHSESELELMKNYDDIFAALMPYQNADYQKNIEDGMKKYYGISPDVTIRWIEYQ